jgi:hypothetical protein
VGIEKGVSFPITAVDAFSAIFAKLKGEVGQAQGSFANLKGYLATALAGLSVGGLAAMVSSTIEAMDHLNDLSKTASLSVESMSGLAIAAKQTGTDIDGLAGVLNKLAVNMGKNAEGFNALGISTKDPLKALELLSDLFKGLEDPQQRAAVMAGALGKSWATAAPLLAEGGTKIAEMVAQGSKLAGVTTEMAQQADELKDKWVLLTGTNGLLNAQVGAALPLLNALAQSLVDLKKSSDDSGTGFNPLTEALRALVVLGGNVVYVFKAIGTEIGAWLAQIGALSEALAQVKLGDFEGAAKSLKQFNLIGNDASARADAARASFDKWEASMMTVGTAADAAARSVASLGKAADNGDQVSRRAANEAAAAGRAFLQSAKDKADATKLEEYFQRELADANKAVAVAQAEQANGADRLTSSQKKLLELVKDPEFKKLPAAEKDEIKSRLAQAAAIEAVTASYKRYAAAVAAVQASADADKAERDQIEMANQATIESLKDSVEQYGLEADAVGKTATQRELMTLAMQREKAMRGTLGESQKAAAAAYYDEIEALIKLREERENQLALYDAEGNAAGKFFSDLLFDTKHAFSNMVEEAKRFGAELAALFAKKYGLQVVGNFIGGSSGATMTQAGVNAGANTVGGTVLNAAGSYISSTTIGGTAIGGFSDAAAGYQAVSSLGMTAGEVAAGEGATWMSSLGAALAEIPVWGWIAAAVIAVAVWMSGQGGGPKIGGSYAAGFTGAGDPLGAMAAPGTQNGRLFTPSGGDEPMRQLVNGMGHSFAATLSALGGQSGGVRFGIGFDSDPQGRAPDRVSSVASDLAGNVFYSHNNVVPAEGQKLEELLALESQRMILAALQASDLPKDVANILNTLDAKTATADQIQKVVALAQSFEQLSDTIAALEGGPVVALQQQLKALDGNVAAAKSAFTDALGGKDQGAILTAEQQLEQAVMSRYQSEINMVRQLQDMIRQTEEAAYQFSINIAGRINSVGGSRDVAGLALNRAGVLQGRIGAAQGNPADLQLEDLQGYVGAIDTWYQSRSEQIQRDAQAQSAQQQAIAQAGAAAAQARIDSLQTELQLAQQFQGLVDRTTQMLTDLKLSTANPASAEDRLALAQQDVTALKAAYQAANGDSRVDAANKLLDALDREKQLGMEAYQRPSDQWAAVYEQITQDITQVQQDAKPMADRALELQQQILDAQREAAGYQAAAAAAVAQTSSAMAALNAEALPYYEWAESEGERLYALQQQQHQEQLDAITGGMEVNLFIASKQAEAVDELKEIRRLLGMWAAANPATSSSSSAGGSVSSGNTGNSGYTPNPPPVSDSSVVDAVIKNAPAIKRALSQV